MEKREKLYEGKAEVLYTKDDPELVIQYFKGDYIPTWTENFTNIVGW